MPGKVLERAIALAVLPVDWRLEHHSAVVAGASECGVDILDPHPDQVTVPILLWQAPITAEIRDDHCATVPDGHLGTVILSYACALAEPER